MDSLTQENFCIAFNKLQFYLTTFESDKSNFEQIKCILEDFPVFINDFFIREDNSTLLHFAAKTDQIDLLKYLINKIDINILNNYGENPLEVAFKFNRVECIKTLILYYKNINYISLSTLIRIMYPHLFIFILISIPVLTESFIPLLSELYTMANFRLYYTIHPEIKPLSMDSLNFNDLINESEVKWKLDYFSQVRPLQFIARTAIRKSLNCNIFYSAKELPLPREMRSYLTDFEWETNLIYKDFYY